ncbi:cytochrome b [Salinisphaera aquimarina]|uniref:Cytochrome b n=1 Tax=Salinisphaera aquimarina TaxID=2094031 RepID=A0ABV7EIB5_9GAMM
MANKFMNWVDDRFPATQLWNEHIGQYYAPKNFNVWYYMGSLAMLVLVNQLVTGIWLAMFYQPGAETAFGSVAYIMRDVEWGWLIRYMHSTGASFFFIVVYLHMFRALLYGSYKKPRELLWIFGCLIYLALMAEAFMGYVLPWGNMSYWGAQVIISLFSAVPVVGDSLTQWIRGDFVVSGATLNRFFALHVVALPFVLVGLVIAHIMALHHVGSNNPDGIEIKANKGADGHPLDGIPFHPYYTVKDLFGVGVFLILFSGVIFFAPTFGGLFLEPDNFTAADPSVTPAHIKPSWYFTPFYAMLRAVPSKGGGVITMFSAVLILFILPWLDRSPVKSIRYKGIVSKVALTLFAISFVGLAYLGMQAPADWVKLWSRIFAVIYFLFFLLMPLYSKFDRTKPVPERVTG